jgi:hypothetical protein
MSKPKFRELKETWPFSKYEVTLDEKIIGVVGNYDETSFRRTGNSARLGKKRYWYAGVEGVAGWTQRSLATRKQAVAVLMEKRES